MKKFTILLLIAILTLTAFTACSAKAQEDPETISEDVTTSYTHNENPVKVTLIPASGEEIAKIQKGRFLHTNNIDEYYLTDNCIYLLYNIRKSADFENVVIAAYSLPKDSVWCGVSHVGLLYRTGNVAHILEWDFQNLHSFTEVTFIICSEYYLMEDNVGAPLFHMKDGTIKAYDIFTNDLIDPLIEGVATLNPSNSGSTVKKSN